MRKLKNILYWVTVIPPILDAVRGLIIGIQKGLSDIKNATRLKEEQERKFNESNRDNS